MVGGLSDTASPTGLVPGDPALVQRAASELAAYSDVLELAGAGLSRIDTSEGWSGAAADAFRRVYDGQPTKWTQAGLAFHQAAAAVADYATVLSWAQGQAADAIRVWQSGKANHDAAQKILDNAVSQLDSAGNTAADTVSQACDQAPAQPGFWSQVGSFFSGVGRGGESIAADAVNGTLSLGYAVVAHPGADLSILGGLGLAAVSSGGDAIA